MQIGFKPPGQNTNKMCFKASTKAWNLQEALFKTYDWAKNKYAGEEVGFYPEGIEDPFKTKFYNIVSGDELIIEKENNRSHLFILQGSNDLDKTEEEICAKKELETHLNGEDMKNIFPTNHKYTKKQKINLFGIDMDWKKPNTNSQSKEY